MPSVPATVSPLIVDTLTMPIEHKNFHNPKKLAVGPAEVKYFDFYNDALTLKKLN